MCSATGMGPVDSSCRRVVHSVDHLPATVTVHPAAAHRPRVGVRPCSNNFGYPRCRPPASESEPRSAVRGSPSLGSLPSVWTVLIGASAASTSIT